jgi:cytochrome oxidase Cu insertion factor (SCO1/SenC/PrrC family)
MEHSSYVYVLNAKGQYTTLITHEEMESPDQISTRLRSLLEPTITK